MDLKKIFEQPEVEHWEDFNTLHESIHDLPPYFRAVLLEMLEKELNFAEIESFVGNFRKRFRFLKGDLPQSNIELGRDIAFAKEMELIEFKNLRYSLTPKGIELTKNMKNFLPVFFDSFFSQSFSRGCTVCANIIIALAKLISGMITLSVGLVICGINHFFHSITLVKTFGFKGDKEQPDLNFILIMMHASVIVSMFLVIFFFDTIKFHIFGIIVAVISIVLSCIVIFYQIFSGFRNSSPTIFGQGIVSIYHLVFTIIAGLGILASYLAKTMSYPWATNLYYGDLTAGIIILLVIFIMTIKSTVNLIFRTDHHQSLDLLWYPQKKVNGKIITGWIIDELRQGPKNKSELEQEFLKQFCDQIPIFIQISGVGYRTKNSDDLFEYLEYLIKKKKIHLIDGFYQIQ